MTTRVKNISGSQDSWVGVEIADGAYYTVPELDIGSWRVDSKVFTDVANGNLLVNRGLDTIDDLTDSIEGWNHMLGDVLPKSELDGKKLAVHSSPKPVVSGTRTYAIWTGCGDDMGANDIGDGPLLDFESEVDTPTKAIKVEFLNNAGRVWIHEGYLAFEGGGAGDFMSADIRAHATPLQQASDLDYNLVDNGKGSNWIVYAGAGLGTHGLAGNPVLLPRTFSKDGDWDYDGVTLTPNGGGTGAYKMCDADQIVHRYINRIPCRGTSYGYFTMSSDETTELPEDYYMELTQHNVSNTVWTATVLIEIYRERTHDP